MVEIGLCPLVYRCQVSKDLVRKDKLSLRVSDLVIQTHLRSGFDVP